MLSRVIVRAQAIRRIASVIPRVQFRSFNNESWNNNATQTNSWNNATETTTETATTESTEADAEVDEEVDDVEEESEYVPEDLEADIAHEQLGERSAEFISSLPAGLVQQSVKAFAVRLRIEEDVDDILEDVAVLKDIAADSQYSLQLRMFQDPEKQNAIMKNCFQDYDIVDPLVQTIVQEAHLSNERALLSEVADAIVNYIGSLSNEVKCSVVSAQPLDESHVEILTNVLKSKIDNDQSLNITFSVQPDILGGLVVSMEGQRPMDFSAAKFISTLQSRC